MWLNWTVVREMPWRQRNAHVEEAVRKYLNNRSANMPMFSSADLAKALTLSHGMWPKLAQLLSKMAPHMAGYALQNGEQITRGGRTWRRWNWYGQDRGVL